MTSLRTRLVATTCLVAFVALGIAAVATYAAYSDAQLRQIDDSLQRSHEPIEHAVAGGTGADTEREIGQIAPGTYVALLDPEGGARLNIAARERGHDPLTADLRSIAQPAADMTSVDEPSYMTVSSTSSSTNLRVRISRLDDGGVLVVGQSMHEADESRRNLVLIELVVTALALVVAGAIGWVLVRLGLRPLRQVEQTALAIAAGGDLEHEVPGSGGTTEVGRLATALDTMLGRIRGAFAERDATETELRRSEERMRQFVADVSHELRTPLTAVSAYAELFERGARDRPQDLERALRGIAVETARMNELVEELLLLARLDEGRPLDRLAVDFNDVVVEAVAAATAVSPEWPVALRVHDVVVVDGDASRLRQVLDNLLANVRTHTPPGTSTVIELSVAGDRGVLTVRDDGPGMPPEQASRVFERFFRADPSRSRSSGGAGLGMSIVHALVTAQGGTIDLDTSPGHGLAITISLALHAPRQHEQNR